MSRVPGLLTHLPFLEKQLQARATSKACFQTRNASGISHSHSLCRASLSFYDSALSRVFDVTLKMPHQAPPAATIGLSPSDNSDMLASFRLRRQLAFDSMRGMLCVVIVDIFCCFFCDGQHIRGSAWTSEWSTVHKHFGTFNYARAPTWCARSLYPAAKRLYVCSGVACLHWICVGWSPSWANHCYFTTEAPVHPWSCCVCTCSPPRSLTSTLLITSLRKHAHTHELWWSVLQNRAVACFGIGAKKSLSGLQSLTYRLINQAWPRV